MATVGPGSVLLPATPVVTTTASPVYVPRPRSAIGFVGSGYPSYYGGSGANDYYYGRNYGYGGYHGSYGATYGNAYGAAYPPQYPPQSGYGYNQSPVVVAGDLMPGVGYGTGRAAMGALPGYAGDPSAAQRLAGECSVDIRR